MLKKVRGKAGKSKVGKRVKGKIAKKTGGGGGSSSSKPSTSTRPARKVGFKQ